MRTLQDDIHPAMPLWHGTMFVTSKAGRLSTMIADHVLLMVRKAILESPADFTLVTPVLGEDSLYPHATGHFGLTLGQRELSTITLRNLLVRYLDLGGSARLLTLPISDSQATPNRLVPQLVWRYPRLSWRTIHGLNSVILLGPDFGILATPLAGLPEANGDSSLITSDLDLRRGLMDMFNVMWREAAPGQGGNDASGSPAV